MDDNIMMDSKGMEWADVDWIGLRVAKMMLQAKTKFRRGSKNMIYRLLVEE